MPVGARTPDRACAEPGVVREVDLEAVHFPDGKRAAVGRPEEVALAVAVEVVPLRFGKIDRGGLNRAQVIRSRTIIELPLDRAGLVEPRIRRVRTGQLEDNVLKDLLVVCERIGPRQRQRLGRRIVVQCDRRNDEIDLVGDPQLIAVPGECAAAHPHRGAAQRGAVHVANQHAR